MNRKSITVTTYRAINYGAVLQAYALQKTLKTLGIDNEILDGQEKNSVFEKINLRSLKSFFIKIFVNFVTILKYKKIKSLNKKFENFVEENLVLTRHYSNSEDLIKNPPQADIYITGSDQVFTFLVSDFWIKQRFLDFGNPSVKKYSYAASLGHYDFDENQKGYIKKTLSNFNGISLRENEGKITIEKIIDRKCYVNIDPVFLLTKKDWMNISIKSRINFEYILCYPLLGNKNFQKIIDQVKQKLNLPVVCVQTIAKKRVKADYYIYDASPNEFLDLIRNSKFVLTSSFHGTAFSIIFEKPFYTLIKDYKPQRMENLTNLLGLEDRIIRDKIKEIDVNIDYKTVNNKLSSEREKSLLYLKEMIKK